MAEITLADRVRQTWINFRLLAFALFFVVGLTFIQLLPSVSNRQTRNLQVDDVLAEDIVAVREVSYVSQILTEQAQTDAIERVEDIYDDPDARIGRQQVRRAGQIITFLTDVRADTFASPELKQDYVTRITSLDLPDETTVTLLNSPDAQFEIMAEEVSRLVEEAMGEPIREGQESETVAALPLQVSAAIPDELIGPVLAISGDLIVANSRLNVAATEDARATALDAIPEQQRTFLPGETVIDARDPITELDLEALEALGLANTTTTWQRVASFALTSTIGMLLFAVFLGAYQSEWLQRPNILFLFEALFILFVFAALTMVRNDEIGYLFPAASLALVLASVMGLRMAALSAIVLAALVGISADRSLEMTIYVAAMGLFAAGTLRQGQRLNEYFVSGIFASLIGVCVLLIFRLPLDPELGEIAQPIVFSIVNGFISVGLALVLLFIIGNISPLTTSIQLMDLTRPDNVLQKRLQREAIGTYHHTLAVANLAEAACQAIGANTLLARAGTMYHDIGKLHNPGFFIENRIDNKRATNTNLSAEASAKIIIDHVNEGVRMAREKRLPEAIIDFIREHHGTRPVAFFLMQAKKRAAETGEVLDESVFYYPGPKPQSRETAILMLSDSCESATRANRPDSKDEIEQIVNGIIKDNLEKGQLDDSGLTLTEIRTINETLVYTLQGMYHPRIKYPASDDVEEGEDTLAELPEEIPVEEEAEGPQASDPHMPQDMI